MKFKPFSLVTVCLAASGCLAIASAAFAQSVKLHIDGEGVQHLTCVKDAQGLMCKTEERDSELAGNPEDVKDGASESLKASTIKTVPQILSSAQLEFISNVLLGFLYFVLPTGIGLGIFLHDKYSSYRNAILDQQITILERLWTQSPHS